MPDNFQNLLEIPNKKTHLKIWIEGFTKGRKTKEIVKEVELPENINFNLQEYHKKVILTVVDIYKQLMAYDEKVSSSELLESMYAHHKLYETDIPEVRGTDSGECDKNIKKMIANELENHPEKYFKK